MNREPVPIPIPLAHVGSVTAWLLPGDPLTLVDTGPRDALALQALEAGPGGPRGRGGALELVLLPPPHVAHGGRAPAIARRSGARLAGLGALADYVQRHDLEVEEDRRFSHALMAHHGVPA